MVPKEELRLPEGGSPVPEEHAQCGSKKDLSKDMIQKRPFPSFHIISAINYLGYYSIFTVMALTQIQLC